MLIKNYANGIENNKPNGKIRSLNGLKVIALFLIFLKHGGISFGFNAASVGVGFFFVAAGFFAYYSSVNKTIECSLKASFSYVAKKLVSILPLYGIGYLYFLLLSKPTFSTAIINLFMLQAWSSDDRIYFSLNGPSWYIAALVFCYFLFPFIYKIIKSAKRPALFLLAILIIRVGIEAAVSFAHLSIALHVFPIVRVLDYTMGMLVAALFLKYRNALKLNTLIASVLELLSLASIIFLGNNLTFRFNAVAIIVVCCVLVFIFAFDKGIVSKALSLRLFDMFYSIQLEFYLLHSAVLSFTYSVIGLFLPLIKENVSIRVAVSYILLVVSCAIYRLLLKKPFEKALTAILRLIKKCGRKMFSMNKN